MRTRGTRARYEPARCEILTQLRFRVPSMRGQSAVGVRAFLAWMTWQNAELPRAVRRPMAWSWLGWSGAAVVVVAAVLGLFTGRLSGTGALLAFGLTWPACGWGLMYQFRARRAVRHASSADNLLCPACLYDLRHVGSTGACPECGRWFDRATVQSMWAEAGWRFDRDG